MVDARTLRDLGAFSAEILSAGAFKRPSKDVVEAAHKVGYKKTHHPFALFDIYIRRHRLPHHVANLPAFAYYPSPLPGLPHATHAFAPCGDDSATVRACNGGRFSTTPGKTLLLG